MIRLRFLTKNLGWKALALAGAVLLWLGVGSDPGRVSFISVPVQFRQMPAGLEISSQIFEHVYLELQGTPGLLGRFDDSTAAVALDLASVMGPGERTFYIDEHSINVPHGMKLIRAIPSQLRFEFERRLTRRVKVAARFAGTPQAGYQLESYEVTPPELAIVGPESRVLRVEAVQTDPIDLSTVVAASEVHVNTFIDDPHVRFQGSPRVTVRVIVRKS